MPHDTRDSDTARLEGLWAGGFGDEYTERNRGSFERISFWRDLVEAHPFGTTLEVGCNVGENLAALATLLGAEALAGIDVNEGALEVARATVPGADLRLAPARALPFDDGSFDLVFTAMVLIHQPDETLPIVMAEIVRCARRYVLTVEYESTDQAEVPYRGERGALFKRPYGDLYAALFPQLRLVASGFIGREEGWDDVTWSLFAKHGGAAGNLEGSRPA